MPAFADMRWLAFADTRWFATRSRTSGETVPTRSRTPEANTNTARFFLKRRAAKVPQYTAHRRTSERSQEAQGVRRRHHRHEPSGTEFLCHVPGTIFQNSKNHFFWFWAGSEPSRNQNKNGDFGSSLVPPSVLVLLLTTDRAASSPMKLYNR